MPLFQKKRRVEETIDSVRAEMAAVQQDLEAFKKTVEKDMAAIRKDFRELVLFLQESPESENGEPAEPQESARSDVPPDCEPAVSVELKDDLTELSDQVAALSKRAEALHQEVETVKTLIGNEAKSIRDGISDAKRDINNKITYAVARLKS